MREAIRGYFDAVVESAEADGRAASLAAELNALSSAVAASEDLRATLSDPGLPTHARRAVVAELLSGRFAPSTQALVAYTISVDRAPDLTTDIEELAASANAVASGTRPPEAEMLGRSAARERIDGFAGALLESLPSDSGLGTVEEELFRFARTIEASPELESVLIDRDVPAERRAGLVADLLGARAQPATARLATYAARYGRPRDYLQTLSWLVDRVAAEANRRVAEVRAAVDLDEDQRHRLGLALARIIGHPVEVRVSVDTYLLGGFMASVGDTVVDGSARHRLELLRERLSLPQFDLLTGTGEAS